MAHDILIVDDEADIRMLIGGVLRDEGYATREAADSSEALAAIQARQPTLVVLDIWLAGGELDLVGASSAVNQLRQQIDRVAPTGSRVMVTGAPGSGKEVVGRLLHARSRRAEGPFVPINCATMRPDRLEIELFGCEPNG